jgi:hypothetical protein
VTPQTSCLISLSWEGHGFTGCGKALPRIGFGKGTASVVPLSGQRVMTVGLPCSSDQANPGVSITSLESKLNFATRMVASSVNPTSRENSVTLSRIWFMSASADSV